MTDRGNGKKKLDLVQIRTRLDSGRSPRLWRGLEELASSEEYKNFLHHEFPYHTEQGSQGISRRNLLKLMGASAAMAGLTACTKLPTEKIVPYVQAPEEIIPGKPLFYATSMVFGGVANGLLIESHMGRPTKAEGNSEHPGSLGAADIFAQASVLNLYDPDRSQVVVHNGRIANWSEFLETMDRVRAELLATQGAGFRILTETVTSPSLAAQLTDLLKQFPKAQWHQHDPAGRDNVREGAQLAFGEIVETQYKFDQADVVLALDSNFLCAGPGSVRYAHDFADKRRVALPTSTMNRLYVVEPSPTATGAQADHRLPLGASQIEGYARWLAARLGAKTGMTAAAGTPPAEYAWIEALARDLENHRGSSIVLAGEAQPPAVHALAHALNDALRNVGKTVAYTASIEANPLNQAQSLMKLVTDMRSGQVGTLVILGANPVYSAPVDFQFRENLLKVRRRIHLGLYEDETAIQCHWHIPATHYLEAWGDARAYDGTVSTIQPLISPLYNSKSAHEVLAVLQGQPGRSGHEIVREYWQSQRPEKNFEAFWETTLCNGVMAGTAFPAKKVTLKMDLGSGTPQAAPGQGYEINFRPDPTVWDGRYANNGFLQECPKPLTKLTWDNAAMVSPQTAQELKLENEDVIELHYQGRTVRAPVWILPGHAEKSVTVHLGYGRSRAGNVGNGAGFNAYELRTSEELWFAAGLDIQKTGDRYLLANTQHHHIINEDGREVEEESVAAQHREVVRVAKLEDFRKNPNFAKDPAEQTTQAESLYAPYDYSKGNQWGMSIDLNSCIGCGACVVACQAENNIAVVGKDQVSRGREMHWIRVDTYYEGNLDSPRMYNEVVPCMQCENAPCEVVCPVGATVHSPEGLNEMIYNRCVGTRYCSNNCPYKVRRFNFFLYSDWTTPSLYGLRNPNVTVRSRGVMEKCTYCIQRINTVKIKAEEEDRPIKDGEILTACQQTCPAQAIVFGDINDPNSKVSKLKAQPRNYGLLTELNTRPRTTYLAKLRNPNPEISEGHD
jgi:MoCo/4Fe-4S cofactor protein with predicted Tat translocation signal